MRMILFACAAALGLAGCGNTGEATQGDAPASEYSADRYRSAIADIARPAADREQDAAR